LTVWRRCAVAFGWNRLGGADVGFDSDFLGHERLRVGMGETSYFKPDPVCPLMAPFQAYRRTGASPAIWPCCMTGSALVTGCQELASSSMCQVSTVHKLVNKKFWFFAIPDRHLRAESGCMTQT
jgi:hypothetical protein